MTDLDALASRLHDASLRARPITAFTDHDPAFDTETGYVIQDRMLERRYADGEVLVGAKLGLASRAMQGDVGIEGPISGWLTDAMVLDTDAPLPLTGLAQPRVEPEIALIVDRDLAGPATTADDVLTATSAALPALEVLDCRFADYRARGADIIADNGAAARFVLGSRPTKLDAIDLRTLGCVFEHNGELVATATGAEVLGHPATAVAWLTRRLAARGRHLDAGMIVLSGGLTRSVPVRAGDVVRACFAQLGSVDLVCT